MGLSTEDRVTILENRMAEHSQLFVDMRMGLLQFEERVDRRFELIDTRLVTLDQKVDTGSAATNQKIDTGLAAVNEKIDTGLAAVNQRIDDTFGRLDRKIDDTFGRLDTTMRALDQKIDATSRDLRQDLAATAARLDARIDVQTVEIGALRRDMHVQFRWTTGLMITGFVTLAAALFEQ